MSLFNRVFAILMLLLLIMLAAVAIVAPRQGVDSLAATLTAIQASPNGPLILIAVSALVIVLCAFLLYLELRRPRRNAVVLGQMEGATAELSIDAIDQRLRREVMSLGDIKRVESEINPIRGKVNVRVTAFTSPEVDVPAKAAEIGRLTRDTMEQRMGLHVGQVWVNIRHEAPAAAGSTTKAR